MAGYNNVSFLGLAFLNEGIGVGPSGSSGAEDAAAFRGWRGLNLGGIEEYDSQSALDGGRSFSCRSDSHDNWLCVVHCRERTEAGH